MTTTTPATTVAPTTTVAPPAGSKRTQATGGRKERTLAKIAPAGGMIQLNTSQLTSAAQAVQTISINGVQVQGVPVTITNAGGELMLDALGLFVFFLQAFHWLFIEPMLLSSTTDKYTGVFMQRMHGVQHTGGGDPTTLISHFEEMQWWKNLDWS